MKARIYFLLLSLVFYSNLFGQMTIQPSNVPPLTPDNIVQNVFLGSGVEIINTKFNGFPASVGVFDNAQSTLGINRGIVMSTGFAANTANQNELQAPISGLTTDKLITDPDLEALAGVEVVDIASFEITFVPSSDKLKFRYVFASEEYPDFVCGDKNDAFGFFITGPNPNGGAYNAKNIALVPDPADLNMETFLDLPVTINSVNGGEVGRNASGDCAGYNESLNFDQFYNQVEFGDYPAFNAFLDVFIASAEVVPCEEYTIKIILGDGKDQEQDSAVFLEERSFSTGALQVTVDNPGIDGSIAEGCSSGQIVIEIPNALESDTEVEFEFLSGLGFVNPAIPGEDYNEIAQKILIPAGALSTSIPIIPYNDDLSEGTEYIYLSIRRSICTVDTLILPLLDNSLAQIELEDTLHLCKDQLAPLEVNLTNYLNPAENAIFRSNEAAQIDKENNFTQSTINVLLKDIELNPDIIAEICIDSLVHPRLNDLDIFIEAPSGQVLELSTDNGWRLNNNDQEDALIQTCFKFNATTSINLGTPLEGIMDLANPTYTGDYLPEGDPISWLKPIPSSLNGPYSLFIVDDQKLRSGVLHSWHISFNPKYDLEYNWFPEDDLSCAACPVPEIIADESQFFYLDLTDSYGCEHLDSIWIQTYNPAATPVVNCEAFLKGQTKITINSSELNIHLAIAGTSHELIIDQPGDYALGSFSLNVISREEIILSGLATDEQIELLVYATNRGGCASDFVEISCIGQPCNDDEISIQDVNFEQPVCGEQFAYQVSTDVQTSLSGLSYTIQTDSFLYSSDTGIFDSIPAGSWTMRVRTDEGCSDLFQFDIAQLEKHEVVAEITNLDCFNESTGEIDLTVTGMAAPLIYKWSNGETTSSLSELQAGEYEVTITDSNSCSLSQSFTVEQADVISYQYLQPEILECDFSNEVYATLLISGGTKPYRVIWNDVIEADTLFGIQNSSISFKIIDGLGCEISQEIDVLQKSTIEAKVDIIEELSCFDSEDGIAEIDILSAADPIEIKWSNGDTGLRSENLTAGENSVTITDNSGCTKILNIILETPDPITIEAQITKPSCYEENDGNITLKTEGGIGNLSYLWDTGNRTNTLNNIGAANYCVTITDEELCTVEQCFTVQETEKIDVAFTLQKVGCSEGNNGGITPSPSGGSGEYLFTWSGPNNFSSNETNLSGLIIGEYILEIRDRNAPNCSTEIFYIDLPVASEISAFISTLDSIPCHGDEKGALRAIPSGGTEPFSYKWSQEVSVIETATNLSAGEYRVTITDAENCSAIATKTLTEPDVLEIKSEKRDVICYGDATGQIDLTSIGGTAPYSVIWNENLSSFAVDNLVAGSYNATVRDSKNCTEEISVTITQPDEPITIDAEIDNVQCFGGKSGTAEIFVENAIAPIQYSLDGNAYQASNFFDHLASGNFDLVVLDGNGCQQSTRFSINQSPEIEVTFMNEMEVGFNEDLPLDFIISNNQGEVAINWQIPANQDITCLDCSFPMLMNIEKSFSGSVIITDEIGCSTEKFFNINVLSNDIIAVPTGFSPNGDQANDKLLVFGHPDIHVNSFKIFTRSGELIYELNDFYPNDNYDGWNGTSHGTEYPQDSYIWTIEYTLKNGEVKTEKGTTTLIR